MRIRLREILVGIVGNHDIVTEYITRPIIGGNVVPVSGKVVVLRKNCILRSEFQRWPGTAAIHHDAISKIVDFGAIVIDEVILVDRAALALAAADIQSRENEVREFRVEDLEVDTTLHQSEAVVLDRRIVVSDQRHVRKHRDLAIGAVERDQVVVVGNRAYPRDLGDVLASTMQIDTSRHIDLCRTPVAVAGGDIDRSTIGDTIDRGGNGRSRAICCSHDWATDKAVGKYGWCAASDGRRGRRLGGRFHGRGSL